ncbi:MAG: 4Fe-4S binding protein [Dysgonamonadaceae bacterium]|nr:4Fe-4S binding protein [Dysgonamonadaceae bacterium]
MGYYIVGALVALWIAGSVTRRIRRRGKTVGITTENCTGCRKCLKICRRNVLASSGEEKGAPVIIKNPNGCTACGNCVSVCRFKALEMVKKKKTVL